jgi:glutamate racemase
MQRPFTVLVTDSGIGGIGIAAELVRTLQTLGAHERATVIFYNALFDADSGYNVLTDMAQKVAILDTALNGMLRFAPDTILLGSNTLSVLYPHTPFSRSVEIPVVGLLDLGVRHILEALGPHKEDAAVILFATPLTVREGVFRDRLQAHLQNDQIIEHACPGLEHAIGDGDTPTIERLIDQYVKEALQRVPAGTKRVFASLHCTHFGYYEAAFLSALQRHQASNPRVLNPNAELARTVAPTGCIPAPKPQVDVRFVSKVHFHPQGMRSLQAYVSAISKQTCAAFLAYEYHPDLF